MPPKSTYILILAVLCLLLAGCDDPLAQAKAEASFWKNFSIIGVIVALLIGVFLGSRGNR
jgi:heme/copper-type cytochrome/quinol oxidase subunit 2